MKAEFVNPFLASMINVLETMADVQVTNDKPQRKEEDIASGDVSGIIGMASPQARGSLSITFTDSAIFDIAKRMLGEDINEVNATVADLVGEITNMVSGGAKKILSEQGYDFDMATPAVVTGKNHHITHKTNGPIIIIPFATAAGKFYVEICFE